MPSTMPRNAPQRREIRGVQGQLQASVWEAISLIRSHRLSQLGRRSPPAPPNAVWFGEIVEKRHGVWLKQEALWPALARDKQLGRVCGVLISTGRATAKWSDEFRNSNTEPTAMADCRFHLDRCLAGCQHHVFCFVGSLIFLAYPASSTCRCFGRQLAGSSGFCEGRLYWIDGWIGSGANALARVGCQTTSEACWWRSLSRDPPTRLLSQSGMRSRGIVVTRTRSTSSRWSEAVA
ncbi:hypothetical protein B0T14DRAFT_201466 [Immersiella caudata]|uniref:Uncharacterized protein n=1 Tax=Immersiella caudata TaxID=314043 RepID=A0AA40BZI8_9PEZI|nr:hypothetical protein B0T14DRAFT_201466 [Immersiella caudata]